MSAEAARLAEYAALRAEILQAETRARDVLIYVSGAVGAILALWLGMVGANDRDDLLPAGQFLFAVVTVTLALLATWVARTMVVSYRRSAWRIATYMLVFLEPRVEGLGWETRLEGAARLGKAPGGPEYQGSSGGLGADGAVLVFLQLICLAAIILLAFVKWAAVNKGLARLDLPPPELWNYRLGMALVVVHGVLVAWLVWSTARIFRALGRAGPVRGAFMARWQALAERGPPG
ncbi:hypothetical protein ACI6QG_03490 [Roseococcus sp. DSY-14]|uniref:hypothetical protein n=1 Tax=Roseococcus sp. DSY-14 TaxID=3369650 RepID=UPI00387B1A00